MTRRSWSCFNVSKSTFDVRFLGFVNATLAYLSAKEDINDAFALAEWLASYLWENISGIYRLDSLEETLAAKLDFQSNYWVRSMPVESGELHVATQVCRSGGHTPLMANLIESASASVDVLLTRMTDVEVAAEVIGVPPDRIRTVGGLEDALSRVKAMVDIMVRYDRVMLHIHPNDVTCAVAVRLAKSLHPAMDVCFINHADHVFSVGIGAASRVFEVSTYGWVLRAKRGTESASSFIGLPIKQPDQEDHVKPFEAPVAFLTGGSAYKFRPLRGMSLPPALDRLLDKHPRSRLTVVGPGPKDWWWLWLRVRRFRRVQFSRVVPRETYRALRRRCAVYIDSHPMGGATAFPEALMSGCNVAGIRGVGWGYSCADELLSANADTFIQHCGELAIGNQSALQRQQSIRDRCVSYHGPVEVRARLDCSLAENRLVWPPQDQLNNLPSPILEEAWRTSESPKTPFTLRVALSDRKWLARQHRKAFGIGSGSLQLMFWVCTLGVYRGLARVNTRPFADVGVISGHAR